MDQERQRQSTPAAPIRWRTQIGVHDVPTCPCCGILIRQNAAFFGNALVCCFRPDCIAHSVWKTVEQHYETIRLSRHVSMRSGALFFVPRTSSSQEWTIIDALRSMGAKNLKPIRTHPDPTTAAAIAYARSESTQKPPQTKRSNKPSRAKAQSKAKAKTKVAVKTTRRKSR